MHDEYTVVLDRDEDGMVIATVPAIQGCHTAGETEEEALALIQDAIRLHAEARRADSEAIAKPTAVGPVGAWL